LFLGLGDARSAIAAWVADYKQALVQEHVPFPHFLHEMDHENPGRAAAQIT
jgi:hypothetical protein